jgi:uncharacterized protein (TIGR03435 family)
MTKTKLTVLAGVLVLVLAGAAVAVKLILFPSVNDAFFQLNVSTVRKAPANLVVVRPTHFANARGNGILTTSFQQGGKSVRRMMGRNVTFQELMAMAYGRSVSRVVLPIGAPKDHYDFLVTVPDDLEQHLQSAVRRKLGYAAEMETLDTPVLALKVENTNAGGLKTSPDNEKENTDVRNGRLYFTHTKLAVVMDAMDGILKTPVVDKTGLTNNYDFSLVWDAQTQQQIQGGTLDIETGRKILAEWGLGLEPDTASMEMLVVKKVK